jgi:hypothetical protein
MYCGLVLAYLGIEVDFETFAVMGTKRDWSSDIEIVKEIGNMKHNRVTRLYRGQ